MAISKHKFELYQLIIFFIQHVLQVLGHFLSMFALLHRFFNLLHNATESSHAKMDHEETKELHEEEAHDGTTIWMTYPIRDAQQNALWLWKKNI